MKCMECRRALTQAEAKKAVTRYKEGKVVYTAHKKCDHVRRKREAEENRTGKKTGDIYAARRNPNLTDLTLEEQSARAALAAREPREEEAWTDWRLED
jgi:hypothetical protein